MAVTKLQNNGFGSFKKHLIFTVTKPHSEQLIKEGWEIVEETGSGTVFRFNFTGRGTGKDEEALFELSHALYGIVDDNCWWVCWERSVY